MNTAFLKLWISIRESMWFVPALMTSVSIALAFILTAIDNSDVSILNLDWLVYDRNPAGARTILSTIAASIITIAGVAFSLNLVILTIASSQYGPRLLKNFIRDTGNQVVLGTFLSTFVYSLIVLLSIRGEEPGGFVPQLAVAFSFLLALISLALLIYFIHHTSSSIQAEHVITSAYKDLVTAIQDFLPRQVQHQGEKQIEEVISSLESKGWNKIAIHAAASGYIQAFVYKNIWHAAVHSDCVVRLVYQVGDFIVCGEQVAEIYHKGDVDGRIRETITNSIIVGLQRTPAQEVELPINQITEIAIRALSPGVNDPHTAITCIHWLGSALVLLATNTLPQDLQYDEENKLRIIRKVHGFHQLAGFCFDTIRFHAAGNVYVSIHILKSLRKVIKQAKSAHQVSALTEMAEDTVRSNQAKVSEPKELRILSDEYDKLLEAAGSRKQVL